MDRFIIDKPMHKCPFWWHHVWIFLDALFSYLFGAQLGTWVSGRVFADTGRMRGRIEFGGFLEYEGLGGLFGSIILGFGGGIANRGFGG